MEPYFFASSAFKFNGKIIIAVFVFMVIDSQQLMMATVPIAVIIFHVVLWEFVLLDNIQLIVKIIVHITNVMCHVGTYIPIGACSIILYYLN